MDTTSFNTDSFRDLTFDLLSGIANDPTKLDEFIDAYLIKLHERKDSDHLRKYTRDIYEKILTLQTVHTNPGFQLKDIFHEKIVVAYFWTFSNIHSSHMMPKLIGIDKRYSNAGVTVIGIHSPKYEHEKHKANIRHAIEEQSLPFNVVNDNGLQVWKHVGCQIWPTVLIFGPDALPLFIFEGENHVQHTEIFLQPILNHFKSSVRASPSSSSIIKTSSEDIVANITTPKAAKFTYPSHLCVTANGQLCISFAGSNQLILCEIDGKVIEIVGNGHPGMADGEIQQVEFDSPHGLVEYNSCIYIADTNNHAIRVFDPNSRRVLTLIGTGRLGSDKIGGLKRSQQPIASPWDLCITESPFDHKTVLIISMAGQHQIWAYAFEETQWWNNVILQKNACLAIIGSGEEGNQNDSEPMSATLAAPRGICNGVMNGQPVLFIADSNSSSIRVVTLQNGNVTNLIGGDTDPKNLSAFGDLDGSGFNAKLQHPLGVAFHYSSSQLYITDTFNNKLKRIDMNTLVCSSYFVTDIDTKKQRGELNSAKFNEPQGLTIFDHFMFIADKNNSHVKRIDLDHGTVVRCRFDLSETLNEERSFGSKQAYLAILLPDTFQLRDGNTGTWTIEDQDGFKICDGELTRYMSDQMLLDYIPRDKQVAHLKYELVICEDDKCTMMNGEVQPVNETDSIIEFVIKIDQPESNTN
ncbi:unnamed protein product [Adineta steineri]|uniref:Thioredoxin-like fold domain-containing protein n=1 Tax=Adineta steineri TaxID=433720 RepID=A0A819VPY8_9BILA|nr:unnamed protein product [Adineta steineri]CAF4112247.1 unnamed protein product [Adineta steineri]